MTDNIMIALPEEIDQKTTYSKLLNTPQWFEKRKRILLRDHYKCRNCGSGETLEVHHRQYHFLKRSGAKQLPWKYNDSNLVTLCSRCHQAGHQKFTIPVFNV